MCSLPAMRFTRKVIERCFAAPRTSSRTMLHQDMDSVTTGGSVRARVRPISRTLAWWNFTVRGLDAEDHLDAGERAPHARRYGLARSRSESWALSASARTFDSWIAPSALSAIRRRRTRMRSP